jgi:large subunit ribosomal protein L30
VATLQITLIRSINKAQKNQIETVKALGLRKIGQTVVQQDNAATRGMVRTVAHLVRCEEPKGGSAQ